MVDSMPYNLTRENIDGGEVNTKQVLRLYFQFTTLFSTQQHSKITLTYVYKIFSPECKNVYLCMVTLHIFGGLQGTMYRAQEDETI